MAIVSNRLFLANWWSFSSASIIIGPAAAVVGPNGSGKSTIFDAYNIIYFGLQLNRLNLTGETRRSAETAIHWTVNEKALRPGTVDAYIILELLDEDGSVFHQGVMITAKSNGELDSMWFWGNGSLESIGAVERRDAVFKRGDVRMEHHSSSKEKAFKEFFTQRGYLKEFIDRSDCVTEFRKLNEAIIRNEGLKCKLSEFAVKHILPPARVSEKVDEQITAMKEAASVRTEMENIIAEAEFFNDAKGKYLEFRKADDLHKNLSNIKTVLFRGNYEKRIKESRAIVDTNTKDLNALTYELGEIKASIEGKSSVIASLESENGDLRLAEKEKELSEMAVASARKASFESGQAYSLISRFHEVSGTPDFTTDLDLIRRIYKRVSAELDASLGEKRMIVAQLKAELDEANTKAEAYSMRNDPSLMGKEIEDAVSLKRAINEEFLKRGVMDGAKLLYECVDDVIDESWQKPIENLIGRNRFGVIVPGEHYDLACEVQRKVMPKKRSLVLDTASVREGSGDMYKLLVFNNMYAERYVARSYGSYVLAETMDEYFSSAFAIMKNGQYKNKNGSVREQAINLSSFSCWFGAETRKREAARWKKIRDSRKNKYDSAIRDEEGQSNRRREFESAFNNASFVIVQGLYDPDAETKLSTAEERLKEANVNLDAIRSVSDIIERQERIESLTAEVNNLKEKQERVTEKVGVVKKAIKDAEAAIRTYAGELDKLPDDGRTADDLPGELRTLYDEELERFSIPNNFERQIKVQLEAAEAARNALDEFYRKAPQFIRDKYADLPDELRTERDYAYISDMADRVKLDVLEDDRAKLEELMQTISNNTGTLIRQMGLDYRASVEMRTAYNKTISRHAFGNHYYSLDEIKPIDCNNGYIFAAALKCEEGEDIPDFQDIIDSVNETISGYIRSDSGKAEERGRLLFDYKQYVNTRFMYKPVDTDGGNANWRVADSVQGADSGGQQATFRYFLRIGVMEYQVFHENSLKLILTDETAASSDDNHIDALIDMLNSIGMSYVVVSHRQVFGHKAIRCWAVRMMEDKCTVQIAPARRRIKKEGESFADLV